MSCSLVAGDFAAFSNTKLAEDDLNNGGKTDRDARTNENVFFSCYNHKLDKSCTPKHSEKG